MNEFLLSAAARLHRDLSRKVRVLLVHSGQRILERELSASLGLYAQRFLQGRGVELRLGQRLQTATSDAAVLVGEVLPLAQWYRPCRPLPIRCWRAYCCRR